MRKDEVGSHMKRKIMDSITRVLNFYNAQMHHTAIPDIAIALMLLKG